MSPEQAAGQIDRLGPATDIYALGGILYTLLTGRPPISPTSQEEMLASAIVGNFPRPCDIHSGIPRALESICLKAMATDPSARYASAAALGSDIEHWLLATIFMSHLGL